MTMSNSWGLYIKRMREARGMTRTELAKRSGLVQSHISKIESGFYKYPRYSTIQALATGLNVSYSVIQKLVMGISDKHLPDETSDAEELLTRIKMDIAQLETKINNGKQNHNENS